MKSAEVENLLTLAEAGERLHCTTTHIRPLIEKGRLPGVMIGVGEERSRYRVREADLVAFIESNLTLAKGAEPSDRPAARANLSNRRKA